MLRAGLATYVRLVPFCVGVLLASAPVTPAAAFEPVAPAGLAAPRATVVVPGPRPDRSFVAVPPAYPAPPPGFAPLPSSGSPVIFLDRPSLHHGHVWVPGRTEVVMGIDATGRIVHVLEYTPGRFER